MGSLTSGRGTVGAAHPEPMPPGRLASLQRLCLLVALFPLLWCQARLVRRWAPVLPEPPGDRCGITGSGPVLRLLVAGDSGAAAVGAGSQELGLCGQLVRALSTQHTVHWCVLARNGLESVELLDLLQQHPAEHFDVVVLSIGANDATALHSPGPWAELQDRIAQLVAQRFAPRLVMHSTVPPMHACPALPQPLRWFMGLWARQMNQALASRLRRAHPRSLHAHPEQMLAQGLAVDRIHPNDQGYAAWAHVLAPHIAAAARTAALHAAQPPAAPPRLPGMRAAQSWLHPAGRISPSAPG